MLIIKIMVYFFLISLQDDIMTKHFEYRYILKFPACEPFDGCRYWLRKNLKFNAEIQRKAARRKPLKKGKNDLKSLKKP